MNALASARPEPRDDAGASTSGTRARPPRYEDMQQLELARVVGDVFRWRMKLAPIAAVVALLIAFAEESWWRKTLVAALALGMVSVSIVQLVRVRRAPESGPLRLPVALVVFDVAQISLIFVTGGVSSPVFPAMPLATILVALLLPIRLAGMLTATQLASIVGLVLLHAQGTLGAMPPYLGGGEAPPFRLVLFRAVLMALFLLFTLRVGVRVRRAFEAVGREAVRARDESLASYASERRTITTMAGAIAHELKNPLATVRALAQLVAKEAGGKSAERAQVVRQEAERMQGILDEFLNFSRPLVPLSQADVALDRLCRDVVLLHEAVALERRIAFTVVAPDEVRAKCDARKVKQIVINLVQNAVAASPPNGRVTIGVEAARRDGQVIARVTVADEGPGIPSAIAARLFEPGVTTKPGGSGLGLTVSRALARQHGGDLTLHSRASGCVGELVLPIVPPDDDG